MEIPGLAADLWPLLASCAAGARLAMVGGAVRDALLHRLHRDPWRGLMDLDLVLELPLAPEAADADGAAPALTGRFVDGLAAPACRQQGLDLLAARHHPSYGTAEIEVRFRGQELALDLATARSESYPQPGANPAVRPGRLEDDLARRDFTINAMAVLLPAMTLLDPHGGQADLARRELRFLHADSLRDDPTRLVRAARYAARLDFDLAASARSQAERTIAAWPWPWRHGDDPAQAPAALATRLRMELELLLSRRRWRRALTHLQAWGGLQLLDPGLQRDCGWRRRLHWARRWDQPRLLALIAAADAAPPLAQRLQLPQAQCRLLAQVADLRERLQALPPQAQQWPASAWTTLLEASAGAAEAVPILLICGEGPRRPLLRWWLRWRHQRAACTAAELMAQGVPSGPQLGQRLRELRLAAIDQAAAASAAR